MSSFEDLDIEITSESASAGLSLEVSPGKYVKVSRTVNYKYFNDPPKDEDIRKILYSKIYEDFLFYSKQITGGK